MLDRRDRKEQTHTQTPSVSKHTNTHVHTQKERKNQRIKERKKEKGGYRKKNIPRMEIEWNTRSINSSECSSNHTPKHIYYNLPTYQPTNLPVYQLTKDRPDHKHYKEGMRAYTITSTGSYKDTKTQRTKQQRANITL